MRIGLLYNIIENTPKKSKKLPHDALYELEHWETVLSLKQALEEKRNKVFPIEGNIHLIKNLEKYKVEICFNYCEGYRGESRESQVPAILEMLGIPYTGSGVESLALTLDKAMTKRLLEYYHLPTPRFQELTSKDQKLTTNLKFPLFAKPNSEGTGIGISDKSIIGNTNELRKRVKFLLNAYHQSVLVEEYIEGRDVTVGVVGNWPNIHIFPVSMINKETYTIVGEKVYGSEMKVDKADKYKYTCPASLPNNLETKLKTIAVQVMRVTKTLDFGRVDFRIDNNNRPYVLEINSLPGISPISDMTLMARAEGWSYSKLVNSVLEAAVKRLGLNLIS